MESPYQIAIGPQDTILVTEWNNHRVQVFSKEGQFLHCFGSKGNSEGHFVNPSGIAIAQTGHVIVCDAGNSCVQIF